MPTRTETDKTELILAADHRAILREAVLPMSQRVEDLTRELKAREQKEEDTRAMVRGLVSQCLAVLRELGGAHVG